MASAVQYLGQHAPVLLCGLLACPIRANSFIVIARMFETSLALTFPCLKSLDLKMKVPS